MSYLEKLQDPRWQKLRLRIFERDKWACQECNEKEKMLSVHHLYYNAKTEPWDYPLEAFRTLCIDCHEWETEFRTQMGISLLQRLAKMGLTAGEIEELSDEFEDANLLPLTPPGGPHDSDRSSLTMALGWLFRNPQQQKNLIENFFEPLHRKDK